MRFTSFISLGLVAALTLEAAGAGVGVATARGYFKVDSSRIYGNSTILEGATLQTERVPSDLRLNSGARLRLAPDSAVKVYGDRFEALGLRVAPAGTAHTAISIRDGKFLEVAALQGAVVVSKSDGVVLARVEPGTALAFDPQQAGAAGPTTISGVLTRSNGHFLMTSNNVVWQVIGSGLESLVGKQVELTGSIDPTRKPAAGAQQVLVITSSRVLTPVTIGGAAKAGMSAKTKVIIAGVIIGGVGAGAGIAVAAGEEKGPISR